MFTQKLHQNRTIKQPKLVFPDDPMLNLMQVGDKIMPMNNKMKMPGFSKSLSSKIRGNCLNSSDLSGKIQGFKASIQDNFKK
jgi:hypothetical protein